MSTTVVQQTVACLFPAGEGNDPLTALMADSGVQAAFGFSLGNDALVQLIQYNNFANGVETDSWNRQLTFFVSPANAATIVAGIPALQSRLATTAPAVTGVFTWGVTTSFG